MLWAQLAPAFAASWDPELRWRTLHTEHFEITFHDGEEALAAEMAVDAEAAWSALTVELDHQTAGKVAIVLVDHTDVANGMAQTTPTNQITIYATNPGGDSTLGLYEDWSQGIVTHELTHILHIDTVEGLPRAARWVFGSLISTHQVAPLWTVEGLATFEETRHTLGGRGRSAGVDMIKRAAVLGGRFPPLGNLDGLQALWPSGNLRYLFGQDFIQFIADSRGEDKWTEWVHRYGASIPFFLAARRTFGEDFVALHRQWKAELEARYAAQAAAIRSDGETEVELVGPADQACGAPSWNPKTGDLYFSCSDPRRGSAIWRQKAGAAAPTVWRTGKFAADMQWRNDGKAYLYTTTHSDGLYNLVDDVMLARTNSSTSKALTDGKRARDASFSPDGTRVVCVTNELQQTQLAELTIDQRVLPLTDAPEHAQFATPRYHPDGTRIAVSRWADGQRDLWLYTADGNPWRRLTWDSALDVHPAWSPDGRTLYFASDRSGVPNIYAIDLTTEHLWRVTNVVVGAFAPDPSPDGSRLAMQWVAAGGTRVATLTLDRTLWKDLGLLPTFETGAPALSKAPAPSLRSRVATEAEPVAGRAARAERAERAEKKEAREADREARKRGIIAPAATQVLPAEAPSAPTTPAPTDAPPPLASDTPPPRITPYNPVPSLFPPRYWLPGTLLTTTGQGYGLYLSAYTGGVDLLRQYGYSGYATYRTDAHFLGGGGSFAVNKWRPVFSGSVQTYVSPYGTMSEYTPVDPAGGAWIPGVQDTESRYWDHRIRGSLAVGYPLDGNSSVSATFRAESRQPKDPVPADVYYAALPTRGYFGTLTVGWTHAKGESYALSISPEKARSFGLGLEYTPGWLGSYAIDSDNVPQPFDQLQLNGEWREYVPAPWAANHVFAWKLSGGFSVGSTFRYGSFRLGGSFSENGITVIPAEWRSLRGFYPSTRDGEAFWLASGEYRFPIWRVDRGLGTVPIFLRYISGAIVLDAGNAWEDPDDATLERSLVGIGAELRVAAIAFYGMSLYGRLGYAVPLLGPGVQPGSIDGLYAEAGTSF